MLECGGAVQVFLELSELAVDVDIAFTAQPVGFSVRRVDESSGLGIGRLHDAMHDGFFVDLVP